MIIQTGMRTDMPAFYSEWFIRRLKAGYVLVRNPYNPQTVTKYSLSPDVVDLIAFCTKNPKPMLDELNFLEPYGQYWFVTITPYGKDIEPNVPDKLDVVRSFQQLSRAVGINSIGWRYDPILLYGKYTVEYHIKAFAKMASMLSGYTETCVISFIDIYEKVKRNFPEAREVSKEDILSLGKVLIEISQQYGIRIKPCAEGRILAPFGADMSGCLNQGVYEKALGYNLKMPKHKSPRGACGCFLGHDIGAYNTCGHLCRYCYANYDAETVKRNMLRHNPNSPLLLGELLPSDKIHEAEQKKWADMQLSFDW